MITAIGGQLAFLFSLCGTLYIGLRIYDRPANRAHERRMRDIGAWLASPISDLNYQQLFVVASGVERRRPCDPDIPQLPERGR